MEYGRLCQCLLQAADLLLCVVLPLYAPSNHALVSMGRVQDAEITTGRRNLRLLRYSRELIRIRHFLCFQRHQPYSKDGSQSADLPWSLANRRPSRGLAHAMV